jgi:hypothetical protein
MKSIVKIAGLCLASMLAMSLAFVASASAAAVWEHCTKGAVSGQTKWENENCSKAGSGTKEWQWKEVNNTEATIVKGSLLLLDKKVPIVGEVSVECYVEGKGSVGPGKYARINEIKVISCHNNKGCTTFKKAEARNLPWQTELSEIGEEKVLNTLTTTGNGEPGWLAECEIIGLAEPDECTQEAGKPEALELENKKSGTEELLVLGTFEKAHLYKCSLGGAEQGSVKGSVAILQATGQPKGWGLRVKPPLV